MGIFYTAYIAIAGCNYSIRICRNAATLQKKGKESFFIEEYLFSFSEKLSIAKHVFLVRSVTLGPFLSARSFVWLVDFFVFVCLIVSGLNTYSS